MKTILVPIDGSHFAEQALQYAHMLARTFSSQVHLLEVIPDLERERMRIDSLTLVHSGNLSSEQMRLTHDAAMELRNHTEGYLQSQAAPLQADGIQTEVHVHFGHAAEEIRLLAVDIKADLIVMATHGYSGIKRWTLGSVADKVIHATSIPVLLIRGSDKSPVHRAALRRLLVPLDGSALASQALLLAQELAERAKAKMILLYAVDPVTETVPSVGMDGTIFATGMHDSRNPNMSDITAALEERRERALHSLEHILDTRGDVKQSSVVVSVVGYPAEIIVDEAERRQVDLIVMATHGYTGIKRWALGSVADKVLHSTQTPLLLIRVSH